MMIECMWGKYVIQIKIRTAEPAEPQDSILETEIAIKNLKRYTSPDIDQIPTEFIEAGD